MIMDLPQDEVHNVLAHPKPRAALLPRVAAAVQDLSGVGWPGISLKAIRTLAAAADQASLLLLLQEGNGRKGEGADGSAPTAELGSEATSLSAQQPTRASAPVASHCIAAPSVPYDPLTRRSNKASSEPCVEPELLQSNTRQAPVENNGGLGKAVGPSLKQGSDNLPVYLPFKPPSVMAILSRSLPTGPQASINTPTAPSPPHSPPKGSGDVVPVASAAAVISPALEMQLAKTAISKSTSSSAPSPGPSGSFLIFNQDHGPPMFLCCPIDLCLMTDPVITADGYTFERRAIGKIHMKCLYWHGVSLENNALSKIMCRVLAGKISNQSNDQPAPG